MQNKDDIVSTDKWAFDRDVTDVFDDMLARSIPQYDVMRAAVFDLACQFQRDKTAIIDLGSSRGEAIAPLLDKFGAHNQFIAVEVSEPMLEVLRQRFAGYILSNVVDVKALDLRRDYPIVRSSVTLSILTLQFTPIEYRLRILKRIYDNLIEGGALIIVEKLIGASAELDDIFRENYYAMKASNQYSQEQIERKRLALEGVLVPMTADWNISALERTGFSSIDCFWRYMNFAGFVAIK